MMSVDISFSEKISLRVDLPIALYKTGFTIVVFR